MKKCPSCGTENALNAKFCQGCGSQLPEAAPPPPTPSAVSEEEALSRTYASWDREKLLTALTKNRGDYREQALKLMEQELGRRNVGLPEKCPRCGAFNPQGSRSCNCGFDLMAQAAQEAPPPPSYTSSKANAKVVAESSCAVCQRPFMLGEDIVQCGSCQQYYHPGCKEEAKGCTSPQCRQDLKHCPFCGEKIKKVAVKCRHCGEFLDQDLKVSLEPKGEVQEAKDALTYSLIGIICFGIILGPLAIAKGVKALNIIREEPEYSGKGKATAGIVIGIVDILVWLVGMIVQFSSM